VHPDPHLVQPLSSPKRVIRQAKKKVKTGNPIHVKSFSLPSECVICLDDIIQDCYTKSEPSLFRSRSESELFETVIDPSPFQTPSSFSDSSPLHEILQYASDSTLSSLDEPKNHIFDFPKADFLSYLTGNTSKFSSQQPMACPFTTTKRFVFPSSTLL